MEITRDILVDLLKWKNAEQHKPILLQGARQTGKTWIMKTFGKLNFEYTAYFSFDSQKEILDIFNKTLEPQRIINELAVACDVPIIEGKTLLIFDEIQTSERVLNSLKYFCEQAPQYHIIAAGSLLGVAISKKNYSVPVGKIEIKHIYPLTFKEFLKAADPKIYDIINHINKIEPLSEFVFNRLCEEFRRYQICGGMPEVASAMLDNKSIDFIENQLQYILDLYTIDFSKYATQTDVLRINNLWKSLPSQLAKENKKFIFNVIRQGARAREYEIALFWLQQAGLTHQVFNISKPFIPLTAYQDLTAFKLYAVDCGLLRRLSGLSSLAINNNLATFTEFKGALTENLVLNSLIVLFGENQFYWTSDNKAEVDFLIDYNTSIIPIEVKSNERISGKSLAVYTKKYNPDCRIRLSMNNLKENDGLFSIPLPLCDWIKEIVLL